MGVFSPPTSTRLTLKIWVSLGVALLLLLQWGSSNVDAAEDNMFGEDVQQQRRSCDAQRLSDCRDYMERRREQPSESCCNELERMSPQCRCRAIQQVFDQSLSYDSSTEDLSMDSDSQGAARNQRRRRRREERGREEEEEEMMERAQRLPNTCNVRQPPRRCDIQRHSRYSIIGSSF